MRPAEGTAGPRYNNEPGNLPPSIIYVVYPSTPAPMLIIEAPGVSSTWPGTYTELWAATRDEAAAMRRIKVEAAFLEVEAIILEGK